MQTHRKSIKPIEKNHRTHKPIEKATVSTTSPHRQGRGQGRGGHPGRDAHGHRGADHRHGLRARQPLRDECGGACGG